MCIFVKTSIYHLGGIPTNLKNNTFMPELNPYVHLHVHSYYSILDGQASVEGIVNKAIEDKMPAVALTDHGAMFGIKVFYNYIKNYNAPTQSALKEVRQKLKSLEEASCEQSSEEYQNLLNEISSLEGKLIKPILGCEAYCARRGRHSKSGQDLDPLRKGRKVDQSGWHLILLAKNLQGYKNLIKMVSLSWTEGFYHRPRIDKELLEQYSEGLIVASACLGGEIPQRIIHNDIKGAEESILWFKSLFGDDYYLELQRHKASDPTGNQETYETQQRVNAVLIELAKKHNVKVIATNDSHFLNKEDAGAHERLICLSTGQKITDSDRGMLYSKEEWFKTTSEMNEIFSDMPEALTNTVEIANKVEYYSIDNPALMPDFEIPEGYANADEYLRYLTYEGAKRLYPEITEEVRERIDFELETISGMGFPGYFLIVQDFIAAARQMGVLVGPGRGSAAGSAVAYCLGITTIDPIKYDLLFERFLNPDRISMPDVDIDFDDDGRSLVLDWVTKKYGEEKVAHIITYGTMKVKGAIKDVARVENLPLNESNRLTKLIPDKIGENKNPKLKDCIEHIQELKEAELSPNTTLSNTIKYAKMLEGTVRNVGMHACGIIIGKEPISNIVPVSTSKDPVTGENLMTTQYEGSVIEETGLIKMDFLGLKTLSVIKEALRNVKLSYGIDIDIEKIPLDDEKTFELYQKAETIGTFQFESAGMQKYLRELKPTCLEDLIAMNALYRPGPLAEIPRFIKCKSGKEKVSYDLPVMERYLKATYGVTVYQEQVMLLSRVIASFTRGESDNLRKAMGKKKIKEMNKLKVKFLEGGAANGHPKDKLEKIWKDWEAFALYAFNKSHATCYSWVAYQTAYLKANYPSEYMAGVLTRNLANSTEIMKLMQECKRMGINVLEPDINESLYAFAVNANKDIRFGLGGLKGVGAKAVESVVEEREKNGPYTDIFNFFQRINLRACNKRTLEALIKSGSFDSFGIERELYLEERASRNDVTFLSELMKYGQDYQSDSSSGEFSLFGDDEAIEIAKPNIPESTEGFNLFERLEIEKEIVGSYLSGHPLDDYQGILEYYCNIRCIDLEESLQSLDAGEKVIFAGKTSKSEHRMTKKNKPFGLVTIEDYSGSYRLALFDHQYLNFKHMIGDGYYVIIHAETYRRFPGSELSLNIKRFEMLNDVKDSLIQKMELVVPIMGLDEVIVDELDTIVVNNQGNTVLEIKVEDRLNNYDVSYKYDVSGISISKELINFVKRKQEEENSFGIELDDADFDENMLIFDEDSDDEDKSSPVVPSIDLNKVSSWRLRLT